MKPRAAHFGGYTLVELIVAMGVFAIIMTLAAGAYFVVLGVNREARAVSTNIDNLSFALENMTRSIRTGTGYCQVLGGCSPSTFTFTDSRGVATSYTLSGTEIRKNGTPITDSAVTIEVLNFTVTGDTPGFSDGQPRVTIIIRGTVVTGPGASVPFTVQTGATMRGIDL